MSVITSDDLARKWERRLVENEARRFGLSLQLARKRVARRIGASPGTLENLSRSRLKGIREWLFSNLLSAVLSEVEREIAALEHEHRTLLELGRGAGDPAMAAVETGIARLKALKVEAAKPDR